MTRALLLVALLAACSTGGTSPGNDLASSADLAAAGGIPDRACLPSAFAPVAYATAAPVRSFSAAEQTLVAGADYAAAIVTDQGCLALDLYEADAPITVNSFVFLALHRYHEGVAFHRVIDGFMAQTGDPNSVSGSPSSWGQGDPGYSFGLEVTPKYNYDGAGTVGMARTNDPNSNGSQFFITFAAAHSLDQQYTIFAGVTAGGDVLPKIVRGEPPTAPTRISAVIVGKK